MIKLQKYSITNYKSCISTKLNISENLTVLIGTNGAGKSNILNSFLLFQNLPRSRFGRNIMQVARRLSFSKATINLKLEINKVLLDVKATIFYDPDESSRDQIYSIQINYRKTGVKSKWKEIPPEMQNFPFRHKSGLTSRGYFIKQGKNDPDRGTAFEILKYLLNISYYGATQFSDPSRCPVSIEIESENSGSHFRNIRSERTHDKFIFDLYTIKKNNAGKFRQYVNTVGKNGIGLIEELDFIEHELPSNSHEVKSGGKVKIIERSKHIVIPTIKIDGLSLSLNQLSEGTFKTLALIFYILNDQSNLLLIEEPEVCVHHGLLSSVIELIKQESAHKQIILSTHSDYVLDMLKPENVLLVNKQKGKGTQVKSLTQSLSKNDFRALREYLEKSGNLGEYWKESGFAYE